ncbi:MAG: YhgN family NAAT transporter [Proteobacteria bacterium]|nr:YhgN family NAAT transporter [Pseudomonadota bacterium]
MNYPDILAVAVTLFFVMDPLGNIPIFNAVLSRYDPRTRSRIVARELIIALVILLAFLFAGNRVMQFLGLTQPTLSLSGGILLFIIALRMIFPRPSGSEEEDVDDPFIVPLAMPLVAGPSTIAILLLQSSSHPEKIWQWCTALVLAWIATTMILACSPWLMKALGDRGVRALERLMGMLLVLLAVQMFLDGVTQFWAGLPVSR